LENDFLNSKPFQSGRKQYLLFHLNAVRQILASYQQTITVCPTLSINTL
jgi:hypothetical protein